MTLKYLSNEIQIFRLKTTREIAGKFIFIMHTGIWQFFFCVFWRGLSSSSLNSNTAQKLYCLFNLPYYLKDMSSTNNSQNY